MSRRLIWRDEVIGAVDYYARRVANLVMILSVMTMAIDGDDLGLELTV